MKYSNFLVEKEFSCDVDKIGNEVSLTSREKKHDMILNLGLGPKGTTFTDQTPTPTQFIRNCEEVGLFQDLQNVNPFEETFRKAVEAAKTGQTLSLDKSYQSNPTDDTLHTPNVFPHITDVPNHQDNCMRPENFASCEDSLLKQDITESGKICKPDITDHTIQQSDLSQRESESAIPLGNIVSSENKSLPDNKVILNVPDVHFVQLIPAENPPSSCKMVVLKNPSDDAFPSLTVKEKLKKSLNEKKIGNSLQPKVPISKCPAKKPTNSFNVKFSKFSKNAFKLISKLENGNERGNVLSEIPAGMQKNRSDKTRSKESRSEFLARCRAASYRCREKKKMYVLYLEQVNNELSVANQNLHLINMALMKQIRDLHDELLKHKNCSAADGNTESALTKAVNIMNDEIPLEVEETSEIEVAPEQPSTTGSEPKSPEPVAGTTRDNHDEPETLNDGSNFVDPVSLTFDVAEVTLNEKTEESEIPLNESNKPPDIIVRFNNVGNDFPAILPFHSNLDGYTENGGENVKKIYSEHSYFLKKPTTIDVDKRLLNYKTFKESSEDCRKLELIRTHSKKKGTFALSPKILVQQRTPPPLILLKSFKKRQDKQIEKR